MNVVYLADLPQLGGAELSLIDYFRFADSMSFHPILVTPREGVLVAEARKLGIECHVVRMPELVEYETCYNVFTATRSPIRHARYFIQAAGSILRLARFLRQHDAAIMHSNTIRSHFYGAAAARLAGCKIVWTIRDIVVKPWHLQLFSFTGWFVDAIITISEPVRAPFVARAHLRPKVVKINNTITLRTISWSEEDIERVRDELHLRDKYPVGSVIGQLTPYKGQQDLIKAIPTVLEHYPNAYFLVVGESLFNETAYGESLRALAQRLGVEHAITFTGFRRDVPAIIGASDMILSTTWGEPLGRSIMEGMTAGKLVIASNAGGTGEIITDGYNGVLFEPRKVDDLAQAIIRMAGADRETLERISRNARKTVQRFDTRVELAQLEKVYRAVLDGSYRRLAATDAFALRGLEDEALTDEPSPVGSEQIPG